MEVHVVVGVWKGGVDSIEAFSTDEKSEEYERKLCKDWKIPYDAKEREAEETGESDIINFCLMIDEWKPQN